MAAHATLPSSLELEPGGIERPVARFMPSIVMASVAILGIAWWLAAQPPPGPGWNDPNGPQTQDPQYPQYPPGQYPQDQHPPPQTQASSPCTDSACGWVDCGDCVSGLDCGDCASLDCGDCSGIDCTCSVAAAPSAAVPATAGASAKPGKSCSTRPWKRLAGSSGLLLPLFVLIGWRRRIRTRIPRDLA